MLRASLFLSLVAWASALRIGTSATACKQRTGMLTMFDEKTISKFQTAPVVTDSKPKVTPKPGGEGSILVTDGSGSFYKSRTMFQQLHDFGTFAAITASSTSMADAKKMLNSRQARYSGLIDVLDFQEGAVPSFDGFDAWLAINADASNLGPQITSAAAAGIKRAFILCSNLLDSSLIAQLESSGLDYTLLRTGDLIDAGVSNSLTIGEYELPVCEDVAMEDVFRFVTEALTLPEANNRMFSLCPAEPNAGLKEMRYRGYERRDEVKAMLAGKLPDNEEGIKMEDEEETEVVMRSAAEVEAEREEELKALIAKAKARGEAVQAKLAHDEAERLAYRKEQEKYYKSPMPADGTDSSDDTDSSAPDDESSEDSSSEPKASSD